MFENDIRAAAFLWLRDREAFNRGIFEGSELNRGFVSGGRRITLKGAAGIWFPAGSARHTSDHPDRARLAERFGQFKSAS